MLSGCEVRKDDPKGTLPTQLFLRGRWISGPKVDTHSPDASDGGPGEVLFLIAYFGGGNNLKSLPTLAIPRKYWTSHFRTEGLTEPFHLQFPRYSYFLAVR